MTTINSLSLGGLAEKIGVPRQRIYNEVKRGHIKTHAFSGGIMVDVQEANRVLDAVVRVETSKSRTRIVFDWV